LAPEGGSHARESAAKSAAPGAAMLIQQPHGGSLLRGGLPGNKGGPGRPKEALREKMRQALDAAIDAISAALKGERLAHDAARSLLADERIVALGPDVCAVIARACADHLVGSLSPR